jgi:S-adenosylmethionine uptake transporter
MSQTTASFLRSRAFVGAGFMVLAGVAFAALNVVTQWLSMTLAFPPASTAFWQYGFALVLSIPLLFRLGLKAMKTAYPVRHILRVLLAAFGVQAWVTGLATVPIWQAIALVMTSPFFIIIGARLFLGETAATVGWRP